MTTTRRHRESEDSMSTKQTRQQARHNEAIAPARKAYQEALAPAWKAYQEAIEKARTP